jgi:hypothetical protein
MPAKPAPRAALGYLLSAFSSTGCFRLRVPCLGSHAQRPDCRLPTGDYRLTYRSTLIVRHSTLRLRRSLRASWLTSAPRLPRCLCSVFDVGSSTFGLQGPGPPRFRVPRSEFRVQDAQHSSFDAQHCGSAAPSLRYASVPRFDFRIPHSIDCRLVSVLPPSQRRIGGFRRELMADSRQRTARAVPVGTASAVIPLARLGEGRVRAFRTSGFVLRIYRHAAIPLCAVPDRGRR